MAAIGVHLGCTSACVAVYKDGRADVVANDAGDRVTPAVVAYSENEEVVGLAAKQSRIRNISNTVMKVKQILGRRHSPYPGLSMYKTDTDTQLYQPEMRSLDLASQQLALRGKNRLAPGDRPEHTELPHLQIGTLLPRSLLQLAFSQSAMATSGSSAGIRWSRQETRTLLSILGEAEYIQRLQTVHHNADVYQAVSKRMQQEGFRRTERQCRSKFKVLKALYLKAYVAHATSMGDPPHCPFYDTLDQLLRNQIVTDPDPDNLMEEAAWPKHCDQNLTASDTPGQEGTSILGAKRTQAADHSPALQTVKESDEDCQLRNSDQMQEASDLEDSWDESSGAGKVKGSRILKAMTLAELAENRRLARELSKREEEKLDRLIAIGEVASAQQDIANELRRDAVVAVIEKNGKLRYEIDTGGETKFVNPEDVARLIFSKMKVITVPFDFGEKQKSALGEAARAAGFNVLRLIHEPSAALLAYGIGQDSPTGKSNILVFKLGGTSLSISVMEVNSGIYRVLSTNTDNIGGTHFTETLAQYLASEFQRCFKHDVRGNARAMMKLMNSADTAKHSLSTLGSANCFLDSLYEGQDFDCNVSRARFELLCSPLFNKCIEAIRKLLEQGGFTADDINKVVLCGGSSRIPRLQQMIKDLFPAVELLNSIPPDEVIPIGAATEAGILIGKENPLVEDSLKIECSTKDILVKGVDESGANSFKVLFPSGTPLPARRQHTLQAPGSISSVCLELYESEGKNSTKEENKFAQVVLQDLDKKENGLRDILAVLTMKRDGSLHVTCTDQETGKCEAITIEVAS
ncbi:Heat shock 70 kDa protein 14 [Camelus dromedarius]|uniref:Heat shock 70 kDa protein 14 n=1 Tax=Camelus dromedarius TaxID=9838 RepID=A0A5N4C575_CAMDR|nr:Heat shock 70 kDa protein 14 [Camelus dromedarius]